jgi:hypothetical protein
VKRGWALCASAAAALRRHGVELGEEIAVTVEEGAVHAGFSELQMIMMPAPWPLSRRVQNSFEQKLDVVIVDAGDGIPEIDRDSIGKARCHPEHPLLASRTGKGVRP